MPRHIETLKAVLETMKNRKTLSGVSPSYVIEVLETILAEYEVDTIDPDPFDERGKP